MERRKLFSSSGSKVRRKLFSVPAVVWVCQDCGEEILSAAIDKQICKNCGGLRFNLKGKKVEAELPTTVENGEEVLKEGKPRISLFSTKEEQSDRYFSEVIGDESVEARLKEFCGKEITQGQADKLFSDVDLERDGLATRCENGNLKIFSMADEVYRLFSSLKITIIKELELDPPTSPIPEMIERLKEDHPEVGPKEVIILKKAHGIPKENLFSETEEWISDSGIRQDLRNEFDGRDFTEDDLKQILEERYDDAPEGTIEALKTLGVIVESPDGILHIKD